MNTPISTDLLRRLHGLRQPLAAFALAAASAVPSALLLAAVPAAAQAQSPGSSARYAAPQITLFELKTPQRVRPGDEIEFRLQGTPRATARVQVNGLQRTVLLTEVRSGVYEGSHVLRRGERITGQLRADATLTSGQRVARQRWTGDVSNFAQGRGGESRAGTWMASDAEERRKAQTCNDCGRITAVDKIQVSGDGNNVAGTLIGGVLGGVIGNQVGGGSGRDAARIVGAIGGAYAGNRVQNRNSQQEIWRVTVRLQDGRTQTFDYADDPAVALGTPVRVQDGVLVRL